MNKNRKFLFAWFLSGAAVNLTELCVWTLFKGVYQIPPHIFKQPLLGLTCPFLFKSAIYNFIICALFVFIYTYVSNVIPFKGLGKGLVFGLFLWLLAWIVPFFHIALCIDISRAVQIYWTLLNLIVLISSGLIIAAIYERG
ncbi:MAG: hypothetical protein ABH872_03285 [Candidatus Omnitrophota bacterium]